MSGNKFSYKCSAFYFNLILISTIYLIFSVIKNFCFKSVIFVCTMAPMDCIIVEDNEIAVILLKEYIAQHGNLNLKEVFDTGEKALKYLENNPCDLLFLDIELKAKGINGIDLIKRLTNTPNIIITTSKTNYAAEAFDFDVADYLVKPFTYQRFNKAIAKVNKIRESLQTANNDFFYIKHNGKMLQVSFKDVVYIEA